MPQLPGASPTASVIPSADMEALRTKIRELEKEAAATQRHIKMKQRFVQQEADRKIEQMALKNEMDKREALAQARSDKLEAKTEMDKRDATSSSF